MFDVVILVAGAVGSLWIWPHSPWIGFLIAFVVLHFFLFCNVFRISRLLELTWASIFVVLSLVAVFSGSPIWRPVTVALSVAATIAVVIIEMKKPSYHGIWWSRVNPELRNWWDRLTELKERA
jgi:hypothetical protein